MTRPGLVALALVAAAAPALGQPSGASPSPGIVASAASVSGASLKLDGRLDEAAWAAARAIGPLTQVEPEQGAMPSEATEVLVLRDAEHLYFGIRCLDRTPSGIVATRLGRDDELEEDDHVMVVLDTFGDRRNGFFFLVNPRGARGEGQISNNDERLNYDWDGIWDAAARIDGEGWTAELAIPFKTLRFKTAQEWWGLNVQRQIERRLETDRWAAPRRDFWISNLAAAGRLEGLADARQGRGLDVRPYASAGDEDGSTTLKLGADVFKNVTPNLTASLTVNTDFAETEADARQVNLTRFPLFYPEKRSFFLEGAGIYEVAGLGRSNSDLVPFYSRRIGLVEGQEVDILAGAKLSGRVDRWNVGFLDVVTRAQEDLGLERQKLLSARVSRNLFEQSFVGALVTHGNPKGTGRNTLVGTDARFATSSFQGDKNLSLDLFVFVTDDEASGRRGHAWGGKLDYPNDLWDVAITFKEIDDDFEPALGFVRRTGIRKANLGAAFMPRPGRLGIRQMSFEFRPQYVTDLDGRALDWVVTAPLGLRFESGDEIELGYSPEYEKLDEEYEIQAGIVVPAGEYRYGSWRAALATAERRRIALDVELRRGGFYDGELTLVEAELVLKPSPHVLVGIGGEWGAGKMPAGDFTTRVFAGRLEVNFSPNLGWSSLVQYDSDSRELGFQSRLRWRIRPVSDLFVVFNRGWLHEEDGSYRRYFDRGSAKLQHTFRF